MRVRSHSSVNDDFGGHPKTAIENSDIDFGVGNAIHSVY